MFYKIMIICETERNLFTILSELLTAPLNKQQINRNRAPVVWYILIYNPYHNIRIFGLHYS
jgi:hypothetical protein